MSTTNETTDLLEFNDGKGEPMSSTLKVLTILTIIGSSLGILGGIWNYFRADKAYKDLVDAQDKLSEAPAWARKMMGPDVVEMARKSAENKLPIMLITLVGSALCLWGALEMRKLKKQGFLLWVVGEFVPIAGGLIFIGGAMFSGFSIIGIIFPIIFLILYLTQRKYLVN